jgi:hypothetical protein
VLVADAGYGDVGEFRQGLDDREIGYVVQVKADTSAYPERVRPTAAPYTRRGRRPRPRYRERPCSLKRLALQAGQQAGVDLIWRRGSKGMQRSRFLVLRVRPAGITPRRQAAARAEGLGWELPTRWLLLEWPTDKAEPVKYWLSNLPAETPIVELVGLGKLRWRIEMVFPQLAIGRMRAVGWGGQHVADLHLAVGHDHPVDEQFDQQPSLRERRRCQPRPDGLAERLDPTGDGTQLEALLGDGVQLALLGGQRGAAAVQLLPLAVELGQRDHLGEVGVQQPLLLALQLAQGLAEGRLAGLEFLG